MNDPKMFRRRPRFSRVEDNLEPVALYLEDLRYIENILTRNSIDFEIVVGDYIYADIEAIMEAGIGRIHRMEFVSKSYSLKLDFGRMHNSLSVPPKNGNLFSAYQELKHFIEQKRRSLSFLHHPGVNAAFIFFTIGIALFAVFSISTLGVRPPVYVVVILLIMLF